MELAVAFDLTRADSWIAGDVYLQGLFSALRQRQPENLRLYLLAEREGHCRARDDYFSKADGIILWPRPVRWTPSWLVHEAIQRLSLPNILQERRLENHGIGVVLGSTLPYRYTKIATLSWIPDFQHLHLPQLFSEAELAWRERLFHRCARIATRVILTTEAARKDFQVFAPGNSQKAIVLPPVSNIPQTVYEEELQPILDFYHLPRKFIYFPGQFWKHKNHELLFRAVRSLREHGTKVYVVCSGNPHDYRHPTYAASLFRKLSEWEIREQIAVLGIVPRQHLFLLMRQTICVLNPSLFEGWGLTVDEARSVGKRVLMSDIPAHREQDPPGGIFFDPDDSADLAEKLEQVWRATDSGPDFALEREARESLPARRSAYADDFLAIARQAYAEAGR